MQDYQRSTNAKAFAKKWSGSDYKEKGNVGKFWIGLLHQVFGVADAEDSIKREMPVPTMDKTTDYIDAYIPSTRVLVEQKAPYVSLDKHEVRPSIKEYNGWVTPYEQAKTYDSHLPLSKKAKWIVTCNFHQFYIYDMNEDEKKRKPTVVWLDQLWRYYYQLDFLVDPTRQDIRQETKLSGQACTIISNIYHKLLSQYDNPNDPQVLRDINKVCVRLVFCFYADDSGIFGHHSMFHDYMAHVPADLWRMALHQLFLVLNQPEDKRDSQLNAKLAKFPYVNGGMFADDSKIPAFTSKTKQMILDAGDKFDWSQISPTIFGSMFETTLNPEERHTNGMHYTSVQNIHKVIDPLFLNHLRHRLNVIKTKYKSVDAVHKHAKKFQDDLSKLTFLDPACGSGNFLTETYLCLRKLENEAIKLQLGSGGQIQTQLGLSKHLIKVSIHQFYGIEINDFAVSVAKTAMWIAESQMAKETQDIIQRHITFLPLTTNTNIREANALEINWADLVNPKDLDYIISNPPFAGDTRDKQQKSDMKQVMRGFKSIGRLDFVACWYKLAADMMKLNPDIESAMVSTNNITNGVQVGTLWKPLLQAGIHINFAYRRFKWQNSSKRQAIVFCVIIGFSKQDEKNKFIIDENHHQHSAKVIGPYLHDLPNIVVTRSNSPIVNTPKITRGSMPTDKGYLSKYSAQDIESIINQYPSAKKYIKPILGAGEFLNGKKRWCLWLHNTDGQWIKIPPIKRAVSNVAKFRKASKAKSTREYPYPYLFRQVEQPDSDYLLIPSHTSKNRNYIPIGYEPKDVIVTNACLFIPKATRYMFGILESRLHTLWVALVSGRFGPSFRYSAKITYNNFPWPKVTDKQKQAIIRTAQGILDARANHKGESLADLYNPLAMPPDLQKAHRANDKAVLKAYGLSTHATKNQILTKLLKMYLKLLKNKISRQHSY